MLKHDNSALCHDSAISDNASVLKTWLAMGLRKPGKTQAELAKRLGVDASVISKMVAGNRRIRGDEVGIIAGYIGENPPLGTLLGKKEATVVYSRGSIGAGIWREADALDGESMEPVAVARDIRYPTLEHYALKIEGNSVNKVAQHGEYAICVPYWDARRAIQDGDLAHVERRNPSGLVEATLKRVRASHSGFELAPESTDPRHQTPLKYDDKPGTHVELCGLVVGFYKPA